MDIKIGTLNLSQGLQLKKSIVKETINDTGEQAIMLDIELKRERSSPLAHQLHKCVVWQIWTD